MDKNKIGSTNSEIEIDVTELLSVLLSRWLVILLTGIFFGIVAYAYATLIVVPQYKSTTKIYVINQENSNTVTYTDLQTGSQLTNDYVVMVESRSVLEQVITSLNLDMGYEELLSKLTVSTPNNTRIIEITVQDKDPYQAKQIADEIRIVASENISEVMAIDSVNVVEEANISTKPTSPNVSKIAAIGVCFGSIISAMFLVTRYLLNDSIKTPDDVERYLGLSTLGSIPMDEELDALNRKNKKMKKKAQRRKRNSKKSDQNSKGTVVGSFN